MRKYEKKVSDFLNKTQTTLQKRLTGKRLYFSGDTYKRNVWEITLSNKKGQYIFSFGSSIYQTRNDETPSDYDILACLNVYTGSLEDFCCEYGYSKYDTRHIDIYKQTIAQSKLLKSIFTPADIIRLQNIR